MRPFNATESNANRVWRAFPQRNSVMQTTTTGQPIRTRKTKARTMFSFDHAFDENASNVDVYDNVAKGVVESVLTGMNGTIFAYGQTSSGKTYTMQGSGSIAERGSSNGYGGVIHMAATDIFKDVENTPNREIVVRVSYIEVYNEKVYDLFGGNTCLEVREDPKRGVYAENAVQETVTDLDSLLSVLSSGEKNRAVAATRMNERSSRSHSILQITIESREKSEESKENDKSVLNASLPSDSGTVRTSTLNLVDLAGSEPSSTEFIGSLRRTESNNINLR